MAEWRRGPLWPSDRRGEWNGHAGPVLDQAGDFEVVTCERCGFRHVLPIPTEEELAERYRHQYYAVDRPLYIDRAIEDRDWWALAYADRYDDLEALLPPSRRRLMDVGSGPGYFLLVGKERGWDVVGIEPSVQAHAHSVGLGLDVHNEFLTERTAASLGTFDAIHISEVVEHLPDPQGMLRLVWRMLAPGGLLYLVLPNDYNPLQWVLRSVRGFASWWVAPPHHLNYFDRDSLAATLERCGFEVVKWEVTFPIDVFLVMGLDYVGNDELGRRCHGYRKAFELNLARAGLNGLRRELYRRMAELGLGRELLMVVRRPGA